MLLFKHENSENSDQLWYAGRYCRRVELPASALAAIQECLMYGLLGHSIRT